MEAVHAQLLERCAQLEVENNRLQAQQPAAPGRVHVQARAPRVSGVKCYARLVHDQSKTAAIHHCTTLAGSSRYARNYAAAGHGNNGHVNAGSSGGGGNKRSKVAQP
eukprot:19332-Heterococcus_DN1.PRE.9